MQLGAADTTPIRSAARPDAPPTVLPPTGARGNDLFSSRRVAPPPAPDPSRRSLPMPSGDRQRNLHQFVYDWGQTALRWETGQDCYGDRNPVPPPRPLVVPPEYAWEIATTNRCGIRQAWRHVRLEVDAELVRMITQTDAPPAAWIEARRRITPTFWERLRAAFTR